MKRLFLLLAAGGALTTALAGVAAADETFIPKGFLYTPDDTRPPAINSERYRIITEADRREAEIYVSKKLRSDFEDYIIHNTERTQSAPRAGWRHY